MHKILCCGKTRLTTTFWLKSNVSHFDREVLYEAFCSRCDRTVLEVCGFTFSDGFYPVSRIKRKKHDEWEFRKNVDFIEREEAKKKEPKDTRPLVFVGEYTLKISRGVESVDRDFVECVASNYTPEEIIDELGLNPHKLKQNLSGLRRVLGMHYRPYDQLVEAVKNTFTPDRNRKGLLVSHLADEKA